MKENKREQLLQEIIQEYINTNVETDSYWTKLEETIQPPLNFMQSYSYNTNTTLTVRSIVLVPFKFQQFVDNFSDPVKFMSAYPNVWDVKKEIEPNSTDNNESDGRLSFTLSLNAENLVSRINSAYKYIVEENRTMIISYDYIDSNWIYYIHCAEKLRDGVKYSLQIKLYNTKFGNSMN